jgi:dTDP-4-dehydrorhamnose reductase
MKILIVGATGMLGYSLFKNLNDITSLDVYGTVRNFQGKEIYFEGCDEKIFKDIDVNHLESIEGVIVKLKPAVIINCIGLIKQHDRSKQHIEAISINSLLPHQLARFCDKYKCKLIHFSTDCIFDGKNGGYTENDFPNAIDLYGRSKALGEVDYPPHLTLRTSIIGHELSASVSLIDWFLSQENKTKGFSKAIFSGLPTCVIAQLLVDKILPRFDLSGVYQLSASPINKLTLLKLVAETYHKKIEIVESTTLEIDRSLNSEKLRTALNLNIPPWDILISDMYNDYKKRYEGYRWKN